jgi:hypothetical protein
VHGTTLHGAERIRNDDGTPYAGNPQPATYYTPDAPMVEAVNAVREVQRHLDKVAVVGLGTGSLACTARAGERWTFYEIDPVVAALARDPAKFRFLSRCTPDATVVLGDARLTLADEAAGNINLMVLDAFSSDAVPVQLAPGGVIVFHISNRYMDIAPVVAASAASNGLVAFHRASKNTAARLKDFVVGSEVIVLARNTGDLGTLATSGRWRPISPDPSFREWTDDYSNVVAAIARRLWPAKAPSEATLMLRGSLPAE